MQSKKSYLPVRVYVASVIALAVTGLWLAFRIEPQVTSSVEVTPGAVLAFVIAGLALELSVHRVATGTATASMGFIVFLGSALVFGPAWGTLITCLSNGGAQVLNRKRPLRIAFNAAQTSVSLLAGAGVYALVGGQFPPGSFVGTLPQFAAFVLTFFLVNSSAVSGVIALSEGLPFPEVWMRNTLRLASYDIVSSTFGLAIAFVYTHYGLWGLAGLLVPILFIRHTYSVNLQLQDTNRELLALMVKAIEARDPYTSGHSQRVAELAGALAKDMHLGLKEVENISTAALLHDVGKIYEEFAPILRKASRLTPEEKHVMQSHPVRSAELVGTITSLHGYVYRCVRHHHEHFDGSGYPDALAGQKIPVGARIIMIADTVDAMTTDRPYRKALSYTRVVEELGKYSGKQFDPAIVAVFQNAPAVKRVIKARLAGEEVSPAAASPARNPERAARLALRWTPLSSRFPYQS